MAVSNSTFEKAGAQTDVYSSIIHNNGKVETTQVSIDRCMNKQSVICTHNEMLSSLKK